MIEIPSAVEFLLNKYLEDNPAEIYDDRRVYLINTYDKLNFFLDRARPFAYGKKANCQYLYVKGNWAREFSQEFEEKGSR